MKKPKSKLKLEVPVVEERLSEEEDDDSLASDVDSDEELQRAFSKGELKAGLNAVVALKKKVQINNVSGLRNKLKQIIPDWQWIERLDVSTEPAPLSRDAEEQFGDLTLKINKQGFISSEEKDDKAQHDFKREIIFYQQAKAAVLKAIPKLHKLGVRTKRPEDYIAETIKSESHMNKIQAKIVARQEAAERSEKARKMRELKKMGKKIQQEVLKQRSQEKRELLDKVKKFRQGKGTLDFLNESKSKEGQKPKNKKPTKKAAYKSERFGYGGKKKRGKYNDAKSSSDMSHFAGSKRGKKSGSGKKQRPGKMRRQQMKKTKR